MRPKFRSATLLAITIAALSAALTPLPAQEFRGSLVVDVVDSSGGAVPAAKVSLEAEKLATHGEQTTDSRGEAHFAALSPATI